ncbi:MAG: hypothetical protein HYU88_14540 [Chloroflexi bacterium]|nr:hypothetical protein [Chloroflexota bacterium]
MPPVLDAPVSVAPGPRPDAIAKASDRGPDDALTAALLRFVASGRALSA